MRKLITALTVAAAVAVAPLAAVVVTPPPVGFLEGSVATGYSGTFVCDGIQYTEAGQPILIALSGKVTRSSGSLERAVTIGTLPPPCRPNVPTRAVVAVGNAGGGVGSGTSSLILGVDGSITLGAPNASLSGHSVVYLDSVQYSARPLTPLPANPPPVTPSPEPTPNPSPSPSEGTEPGGGGTDTALCDLLESLDQLPDPRCPEYN